MKGFIHCSPAPSSHRNSANNYDSDDMLQKAVSNLAASLGIHDTFVVPLGAW